MRIRLELDHQAHCTLQNRKKLYYHVKESSHLQGNETNDNVAMVKTIQHQQRGEKNQPIHLNGVDFVLSNTFSSLFYFLLLSFIVLSVEFDYNSRYRRRKYGNHLCVYAIKCTPAVVTHSTAANYFTLH